MVIFAISWNDRELKIVGEVFEVNGGYPAAMCDGSQGGIVSSWEIGARKVDLIHQDSI